MVRAWAVLAGGVVSLFLLTGPSAAEGKVPLSRVLLTETDLRASIAKAALTRYYLVRSIRGYSQADGSWQEATERAVRSLRAVVFYVESSLALSQGELRRDLEALKRDLQKVAERIVKEPAEALEALEKIEQRLREVLDDIDRSSRTYKGSPGWVPSWSLRDGQVSPGPLVPSQ